MLFTFKSLRRYFKASGNNAMISGSTEVNYVVRLMCGIR